MVKISIITVVYNNPQVGQALDSIFAQQLAPGDELEVVVIDGGSSIETLTVIEEYRARIAVYISERDGGIYDGMNKGLERASGDVIGTLNSDDLYQDDQVLATVMKSFLESSAQVVYGDLVYVQKENPAKVVRYWRSRPYQEGLFEMGWMPPHPTFFVRREVYQQYGRFDLDYRLAADFELTMRFLARAQVPSKYVPKVLVRMRLGGATNKNLMNILKANLESQRACKKNHLKVPAYFILMKIFSKVPQFFSRARDI
jgi:glycosyltransferase involved in cell wall biosynthesis